MRGGEGQRCLEDVSGDWHVLSYPHEQCRCGQMKGGMKIRLHGHQEFRPDALRTLDVGIGSCFNSNGKETYLALQEVGYSCIWSAMMSSFQDDWSLCAGLVVDPRFV
jgi:hypothetical protein